MARFLLQALSEWTVQIEDQFGEGDRVVTRFSATAKHTGPLGAAKPSGKRASIGGIVVSRFAGGKMVETWLEVNAWAALREFEVGRVVDSVIATMS
jgi:predicted ester cyclase